METEVKAEVDDGPARELVVKGDELVRVEEGVGWA